MGGILDKDTVLTSEAAIQLAKDNIQDVLILAGYFSPWWGEHAQVRRAHRSHISESEVAVVEIKPSWKLTDDIRPLRLASSTPNDETDYTVFSIPMGETFNPGDDVAKTSVYHASQHTPVPLSVCENQYPDVMYEIKNATHVCLHANSSICRGCLGSPVSRIRKNTLSPNLLGVIIRGGPAHQILLMLKTSAFEDWLNYIYTIRAR